MADSLYSNDGGAAADTQRSLVETAVEAPSHKFQSSEPSSSGFSPMDTTDVFDSENNTDQGASLSLFHESAAYDSVLVNNSIISVQELVEETLADTQEEVQVKCSTKCAVKIRLIDDTALIEPFVTGNEDLKNDGNGNERHRKRQETEEKKVKRPRRRRGKGRKDNNIVLNYYPVENNKEKKGLQYSRKEMEVMRFEGLEEQKKVWVEVYCGFSPLVQQEYDGLVELGKKTHQEDNVPVVDFDPRSQFQKSADLGEGCLQFADNPLEEIGCASVEEECSEDDDSDEDYSGIQRPAFLVTGEPDFDSGPPQDGLEYLRRVRWEANRVPKVTVAKVNKIKEQSVYMPQIPDIMKCPENLLPLKQWEDSFLADFSELRLAFTQLDPQVSSSEFFSIEQHQSVNEENILDQILENNTFKKFVTLTSIDDSCMSETSDDAKVVDPQSPENPGFIIDPPTLSKILKMDYAARTSMLKKRIRSLENASTLSHDDNLWLFALCVAVDWPFDADTSAAFRSLLRKCASLRAAKEEVDDEVVVLNVLVTISGRYFGQLES